MTVTEMFTCVKGDHKVWKGNRRGAWRLGAKRDGRGAFPTCLRWELSPANYTALKSSAFPSPPSSLLSVSLGRHRSPGTPEDSKHSSGSFYFMCVSFAFRLSR